MGGLTKAIRFFLFGEDKTAGKTFDQVGRKAGQADSAIGKIKGTAAKMGGAIVAAFAVDVIVDFARKAIDAYSRLEDATAAASTIFGRHMKIIEKRAKTAAKELGMSKSQVMDGANTFGTYGKSAGLAGKKLADFAVEMITLAGDMASFRGTSPEQAIEAIGSALRGEMEPIRAYGVLLDDATLRNEALRLGLIKNTKTALTPQQKVLAAQAAILRQTKDAQGDYARTQDSTANKTKSATARWENFSAVMGEKLAPVLIKLIDGGEAVLDWLEANPEAVAGSEAAFNGLVGVVEFLGSTLGVVLKPALIIILGVLGSLVRWVALLLDAIGMVPNMGWAKDAAANLRAMGDGAWAAVDGLNGIKSPTVETAEAVAEVERLDTSIKGIKDRIVAAKVKGDEKELTRLKKRLAELQKQRYEAKVRAKIIPDSRGVKFNAAGDGRIAMRVYHRGGRPKPGEPALFNKEEVWIPDGPGTVMTPQQLRSRMGGPTALGGTGGGGSSAVYVQIDARVERGADPHAFARDVESALKDLQSDRRGQLAFLPKKG